MTLVPLDASFWRKHFLVSAQALRMIHAYLLRCGVAHVRELAEIAVRNVLERQAARSRFLENRT